MTRVRTFVDETYFTYLERINLVLLSVSGDAQKYDVWHIKVRQNYLKIWYQLISVPTEARIRHGKTDIFLIALPD